MFGSSDLELEVTKSSSMLAIGRLFREIIEKDSQRLDIGR